MIDTSISLLSHDYTHRFLRDLMGRHGLIVIGVGRAGERGFQMLYRFSDICDSLKTAGSMSSSSIRRNRPAMSTTQPRFSGRDTGSGPVCFWTTTGSSFVLHCVQNRFGRFIWIGI